MGFEDEFFDYCLAFSDIRLSDGSLHSGQKRFQMLYLGAEWKLSHEAATICAVLTLMPDPNVIPTASLTNLFQEGGQRQFPRTSPEGINKSLSKLHDVNHALIKATTETRSEVEALKYAANLRLRNHLLVMAAAAVLARLPEIVGWILGWF